jgi:hypothetical protein
MAVSYFLSGSLTIGLIFSDSYAVYPWWFVGIDTLRKGSQDKKWTAHWEV